MAATPLPSAADNNDDNERPTEESILAARADLALSFALVTTSLLVLNPHDPLPRELAREFGFTLEEQYRCRQIRTYEQLRTELDTDPLAMCRYLTIARHALAQPAIWAVVAASLDAKGTVEERSAQQESCRQVLEFIDCLAEAELIRTAPADVAETTRLQQLALAGLFARLGPTIRPGIAPRPAPETPAPVTAGSLPPLAARVMALALTMVEQLPNISEHPVVRGLTGMHYLQASVRLPLLQRLVDLPEGEDISLSEEESLVLYQAAQVALLALVVEVTPLGTWEDWMITQNATRDHPNPALAHFSSEDLEEVDATARDYLQAFSTVIQDYFGPAHPSFQQAQTEVEQLLTLF